MVPAMIEPLLTVFAAAAAGALIATFALSRTRTGGNVGADRMIEVSNLLSQIDMKARQCQIDDAAADRARLEILAGLVGAKSSPAFKFSTVWKEANPTRVAVLTLWAAALAITAYVGLSGAPRTSMTSAKTVVASAETVDASTDGTASLASTPGFDAMKNYVDRLRGYAEAQPATTPIPNSDVIGAGSQPLPDVETMISRLAARLESEPEDAAGWKTLAWSYFNTGRYPQAVTAYERAVSLTPSDDELRQGLAAAKAKAGSSGVGETAVATKPEEATPSRAPTADDMSRAAALPEAERTAMIRGMVDRLSSRLETAPNDEDGWLRLLRARVVLQDQDAAKAALAKALAAFANDKAAKDRIAVAARELGIQSN